MTEYGILAVKDEVPRATRGPGSARTSPLSQTVETVMADDSNHGKAVCIALYDTASACSGGAATLRARFGRKPTVRGLTFSTRKQSVRENGEVLDKHALWMVYNPDQVIEGEWEDHQAAEAQKAAEKASKAR